MGYFLQKLAAEAEAATEATEKKPGIFGKAKDKVKSGYEWTKGKVKSLGQKAMESKPGKWVKNNKWKTGIGAAVTAGGIGAVLGRKKIKKALGYGDDD